MKHVTLLAVLFVAIMSAACATAAPTTNATAPTTPAATEMPVSTPATAPAPTPDPEPATATDPSEYEHELLSMSQEHDIGVCAASHFMQIEDDQYTTAVVTLSYPTFSDENWEVGVYIEAFLVSKLDNTTADYLEHITQDPPAWGAQDDGPTVMKKVDDKLWHVIAPADVEAECPGASTPWDMP